MPDEKNPQQSAANETSQSEQETKPALPENIVDVQDAGTLKKKISITVPRARIDAKFAEMFGELSHSAQIPGFRVGHAPRRLIEKRFGKEIGEDVRNAMISEAIAPALEKSELKMLGEPQIDLDKIQLPDSGDMTFSFEIEVMPEFELPALEGIKVTRQKLEMTDARVDEYLEQLRVSRARFEPTDSPAAEGDTVLAGAKISGEGIATVERPGLNLRVAPGQVEGLPLVDLGTALAGKKAGQKATLKVKAPAAHPNEEWREKELTVEIELSDIRRRVLPEVNEEFAKSLGFESLSEVRDYINVRMKQRIETETQQSLRDQVCKYLLDSAKFELPEGAAARYAARVLQRRYVELMYRGVPQEQINERLTELQAAATEQAKTEMKLSFILKKIADDQKVEVHEGEVNARIAQMAAEQGRRPERLRQELGQDGSLEALADSLREARVLDNLLAKAEVTEATEAPAGEEKAPAKEKKSAKAPKSAKKAKKKSAEEKSSDE
jgi:trigger factor